MEIVHVWDGIWVDPPGLPRGPEEDLAEEDGELSVVDGPRDGFELQYELNVEISMTITFGQPTI